MLTKNQKREICKKHGITAGDTGSYEIQLALMDAEIIHMKQHVIDNPNDKYAKRGLRTVEKKRADLLRYLKEKQPDRLRQYMERIAD